MNDTASATYLANIWNGFFPSGQWTHLVVTYKNPTCKIYRNGTLYTTIADKISNSISFNYNTALFANCPNNGRYLNDYRIYNHCLS
jgi:hypothetical protein